jgi:hypothetical protein
LHDLISEGAQEKSWKFRILDQTRSIGASTTMELYTFGMIILSPVFRPALAGLSPLFRAGFTAAEYRSFLS